MFEKGFYKSFRNLQYLKYRLLRPVKQSLTMQETISETKYEEVPFDVLQLKKIELEIAQLTKPWYTKPGYMAILIPGLIALVSLCVGIYTGVFDVKKEKLELEQLKLQKEIVYFKEEKTKLKTAVDSLLKSLNDKEEFITEIRDKYNCQLQTLQEGTEKLKTDLEKNKQNAGITRTLYEERIKSLESNIEKLFQREKNYKLTIKERNDSISMLNNVITTLNIASLRQQYANMVDMHDNNLYASVQTKLKNMGYYKGSIDGLIGANTKQAIREFKIKHNLGYNAILDKNTIVEINLMNYLNKE